MRSARAVKDIRALRVLTGLLLAYCCLFSTVLVPAQLPHGVSDKLANKNVEVPDTATNFRIEKVPVAGGSEILTIFARQDSAEQQQGPTADLPLVSVLRDTLGDQIPENDRLRYVWMLNYTRPSLSQKVSAF